MKKVHSIRSRIHNGPVSRKNAQFCLEVCGEIPRFRRSQLGFECLRPAALANDCGHALKFSDVL